MSKQLREDLGKLLERHHISEVLRGIAEILQEPDGCSALMVSVGKVIEDLRAQAFWD